MAFLRGFEFEVKHIKGKENKVVDALIWINHEVYEITMSLPEGDLLSRIKIASINTYYVVFIGVNHLQYRGHG